MTQRVKNLPAMQELQEIGVQSLGREDPLEKGMQPTATFLPGESHGLYSPWSRKRSDITEPISLSEKIQKIRKNET